MLRIPGFLMLVLAAMSVAQAGIVPTVADSTGVIAGVGDEDDPWLIDVDALLREGFAVIVTDTDTVALADASVDTIRVAAPRLRVSEVVRRVSEAMADAGRTIGEHAFTELARVDAWSDRHDPARVKREEYVDVARIHVDADGEQRRTRLLHSKRVFKSGELVDEEIDEKPTEEWQDEIVENAMAMPFDLLTANDYRYEILERTLIGEHLVFRIGFEPKSRFKPGLRGEVWIDYSDFVIRRMEGAMVGPMPVPLIMRGIPRFTFTLKKDQGRWVADAFHAVIELNGSLPRIPDELEIHVTLDQFEFGPPIVAEEVLR